MIPKYHLSNGCSFSTKKAFLNCHQRLSELLGLEPTIQLAKGGRGNDRMVTTTMHWFYKNPERFADTFVSIGWTSGHRWDFIHGPTDTTTKGIKGELAKFSHQWGTWRLWENDRIARDPDIDINLASAVRLYTNILTLQYFFKYHKIPYVMYWALTNDLPEDGDLKVLKDQIDRKHFMNLETSDHVKENIKIYNEMKQKPDKVTIPNKEYVQSHFEFCAFHGWTLRVNDAHPNKEGHHEWANLLHHFIVENKIIC